MTNPSPAPKKRLVLVGLAALLAALIVAAAVLWLQPRPVATVSEVGGVSKPGLVRLPPGTELGGPFSLVDHDGRAVTDASYAGKFMLIFFGFTHCPDVCPTELSVMATAMDDLGADAERVQPLLVSIDPARDTPDALKQYVASFHPRIVGLTGSDEQVAAAAKAFRVYYAKGPTAADGGYNMDHTAFTYLMGPDGKLRSVFRGGASPEIIAGEIKRQIAG
ncbi:MAG: SCO family protein [Alphaproteobacteria bacterium]